MDLRTARLASSEMLEGEKLYLKRAKETLPYLVRQAKAWKTIYYSDLAEEIGIPNPRNFNFILGAIGNALMELGSKNNIEIPQIQCLVINKATELPGKGIGWFIEEKDFDKLTKSERKEVVNIQLTKIFLFQKWDWVLSEFNLAPLKIDIDEELEKAKAYQPSGGESEFHRNFKEYIAKNPACLGLNASIKSGTTEYRLPSQDAVDVVFTDNDLKIGVEAKSRISPDADITRGLFQCVKYKYLIEAEQAVRGEKQNSRVILALEGTFPTGLIGMKNILGIEVIDNVKINGL